MAKYVEDETWALIEETLKRADKLCTAVISGQPGQMKAALSVVSGLTDLKRQKPVAHGPK